MMNVVETDAVVTQDHCKLLVALLKQLSVLVRISNGTLVEFRLNASAAELLRVFKMWPFMGWNNKNNENNPVSEGEGFHL